jgi:hypothetical protein
VVLPSQGWRIRPAYWTRRPLKETGAGEEQRVQRRAVEAFFSLRAGGDDEQGGPAGLG